MQEDNTVPPFAVPVPPAVPADAGVSEPTNAEDEVGELLAMAETVARRTHKRFVPDPDKIARFRAAYAARPRTSPTAPADDVSEHAKHGPLFPIAPDARAGKEPCGECHISPGETCDICGATAPAASTESAGYREGMLRAAEIAEALAVKAKAHRASAGSNRYARDAHARMVAHKELAGSIRAEADATPDWMQRGNSDVQVESRRTAQRIIDMILAHLGARASRAVSHGTLCLARNEVHADDPCPTCGEGPCTQGFDMSVSRAGEVSEAIIAERERLHGMLWERAMTLPVEKRIHWIVPMGAVKRGRFLTAAEELQNLADGLEITVEELRDGLDRAASTRRSPSSAAAEVCGVCNGSGKTRKGVWCLCCDTAEKQKTCSPSPATADTTGGQQP